MYRTITPAQYNPQSFFGMADLGDECWEWLGSKYHNGYGKLGKTGIMAHRIAYELVKGEVPTDMCLDHLCKNRLCVKPDHLEIVTLVENVMRGESQHAQNARKTHCKNGHEFNKTNTYYRKDRTTRECRICRTAATTRFNIAKKEG